MALGGKSEKIKENVWKLERGGQYFSAKRYQSGSTAMKVNYIHAVLQEIEFPHTVPVIHEEDRLLFIQPWLEGAKAVNFRKRADRTDSLAALHALHGTKVQHDWHASPYLHPYPLLTKWEDRIIRFRDLSGACEAYIGKGKVDEILFYALNAITIIKRVYKDQMNGTLLHGDVVHHNIMRDSTGIIRFIDFDLACTGPAGTEIALWIHRVLPQIDYDLDFLLDEQPSLQKLDQASKTLLLFPNELLREWLYFFTLSPSSRERQAKKLIPFTESALSHWPKLWYDVERINI
ncbi:phosphotransferase [Sporosarcina beigongshangi]|uniref:phosphotransferase n=1 Tax=Sporosarcina beigongshangi TaxID=2782538 RepID=UPI001939CCF6|nr:phosphotransferase [Sporosarcina beigongshangi]